MKPYEVIKSEKVFSGRILDIVHETITLPDGKNALREIVVRGPAAAAVAVDENGRIIFVKQYRAPFKSFELEIPAGMMDDGEDPICCVARELTEETGKIAGDISFLLAISTTIGFCDEVIYIYLARELKNGKQHFDDDEFIETESFTLDEAIAKIMAGEIKDAKTIAGIFAYKELCKN